MTKTPNISSDSSTALLYPENLELLQQINRNIPGSVQYTINRYKQPSHHTMQSIGVFTYHVDTSDSANNYISLRFCVFGNVYCKKKEMECDHCQLNSSSHCAEKTASIDVLTFTYAPSYLLPFAKTSKKKGSVTEKVFSFSQPESFTTTSPIDKRMNTAIEAFLNHSYTDSAENIFINAQTQILLLYAIDLFGVKEDPTPTTSGFLKLEEDRQKIQLARQILLEHIGNPITIKALSRKVAINECYLKKGFKEIFGTTIFDFYQGQRMEHAKFLLMEKKLSVTEVSASLGYSSISHFSIAFKKHTGLKPCELLHW